MYVQISVEAKLRIFRPKSRTVYQRLSNANFAALKRFSGKEAGFQVVGAKAKISVLSIFRWLYRSLNKSTIMYATVKDLQLTAKKNRPLKTLVAP